MFGITQLPLFRSGAIARERGVIWASSLTDFLSARRRARSVAALSPQQGSCGPAIGTGGAYNQEAFHYLLALEEQRFERAQRPFALALVAHRPSAPPGLISAAVAAQVFSALSASLRETDVIGWYDEGRIVGAILTPLSGSTEADASRQMVDRITSVLRGHAAAFPHRVDVRVYRGTEAGKR